MLVAHPGVQHSVVATHEGWWLFIAPSTELLESLGPRVQRLTHAAEPRLAPSGLESVSEPLLGDEVPRPGWVDLELAAQLRDIEAQVAVCGLVTGAPHLSE
jgi:hypothetical protein